MRLLSAIFITLSAWGFVGGERGVGGSQGSIWEVAFGPRTRHPSALLLDTSRLYRALPYLKDPPMDASFFLVQFNSTGVGDDSKLLTGRGEVENVLRLAGEERGDEATVGGGLAYLALSKALPHLPYDSSLLLVTHRHPSDPEFARNVVDLIIAKRAKLFVLWTGFEDPEDLGTSATRTGGTVIPIHPPNYSQGNQTLHQVTLAIRRDLKGETKTRFVVDPSISSINVVFSGPVREATITSPNGEVQKLSTMETALPLRPRDMVRGGNWEVRAESREEDPSYDLLIEAAATGPKLTATRRRGDEVGLEWGFQGGKPDGSVEVLELLDSGGRLIATIPKNSTGHTSDKQLRLSPDLADRAAYLKLTGKLNQGGSFERMSRLEGSYGGSPEASIPPLPTSLEVRAGSEFWAERGQQARIVFQVRNNLRYPANYFFLARDPNRFIRGINPASLIIDPRGTAEVVIQLLAEGGGGGMRDEVALTAQQETLSSPPRSHVVTKRVYFNVGRKPDPDTTSPDISYTYSGSCGNNLSPQTCFTATWTARITIQDSRSGLLSIKTEPEGLNLKKEFIVGTWDPVEGEYTASCCTTKLFVSATDIFGNTYQKTIDIEKIWLSSGEIAAIVLGIILLILLIIAIGFCIAACLRRRKTSNYYVNN